MTLPEEQMPFIQVKCNANACHLTLSDVIIASEIWIQRPEKSLTKTSLRALLTSITIDQNDFITRITLQL